MKIDEQIDHVWNDHTTIIGQIWSKIRKIDPTVNGAQASFRDDDGRVFSVEFKLGYESAIAKARRENQRNQLADMAKIVRKP